MTSKPAMKPENRTWKKKGSRDPLADYEWRAVSVGSHCRAPQSRCFLTSEPKGSDTPLIDHLVMREFVSGPPSYRFIYERVRDRKPSLRKGS